MFNDTQKEIDETTQWISKFEKAKDRWVRTGEVCESDVPVDEAQDFRVGVLKLLDAKIEIGKYLLREAELSSNFDEDAIYYPRKIEQ